MYDVWNLWNGAFEKFSCTISNIYIGFSRFWGQIQWINFGFYSHFNPFIYWDIFVDSKILFSEPFILNDVFWGNFWHFVLFQDMLASSGVKVSILGVTALWDDCMAFPANQGSKISRDFSGLENEKEYRVVSNRIFWVWNLIFLFISMKTNFFFTGSKPTKNQAWQNLKTFNG